MPPPHADEPFTEPWQARAFAMAVLAVDELGLPWDAFRDELKAAIEAAPDQPYFESWLDALSNLIGSSAAISEDRVAAASGESSPNVDARQ